jgi:hypothetical protein
MDPCSSDHGSELAAIPMALARASENVQVPVALTVHLRKKSKNGWCRKTLEKMVERKGIEMAHKVLFL